MPQVLIRNLDSETVQRLKSRAKANDRSLEAELRQILERAATEKETREESLKRMRQFRARFEGRVFSDSTELIREDRER